jgi:DNA-binding transcriptional MerR regulator
MLTVTKLARRCGLSRGTVLYYESVGLLRAPGRSGGNYRVYGEQDLQRLQQIRAYREAGLKLEDIRAILHRPESDAASVLVRRLGEIATEIDTLRDHQRAILKLLPALERTDTMTKDKWVSIMRTAGFKDEDMKRWHTEFELSAPQDHQEFLEYLHIPAEEIRRIREWSAKG